MYRLPSTLPSRLPSRLPSTMFNSKHLFGGCFFSQGTLTTIARRPRRTPGNGAIRVLAYRGLRKLCLVSLIQRHLAEFKKSCLCPGRSWQPPALDLPKLGPARTDAARVAASGTRFTKIRARRNGRRTLVAASGTRFTIFFFCVALFSSVATLQGDHN